MAGIPAELLQQIANPQGPQNVLEMFARGNEQGFQNQERGWNRKHRNALIAAATAGAEGRYQKAAQLSAAVGDTAASRDYITMYDKQQRDNRLKQWLEPQLGMGGGAASVYAQGPPQPSTDTDFLTDLGALGQVGPPEAVVTGPVPNRGLPDLSALDVGPNYRGTIGGDGQPRMAQMPRSMTRMGSQPTGNQALARALYASGDLEGAIKELYRDRATPDMIEYQLGVEQGYNGSFRQWQLEAKRAGANSVSVDMKGLSAEESAGKERGTRMDLLESGKGIGNLQQIQLAGRLLQNVDTGALAGMKGTAGNIFASLGLPVEGLKYLGIDPQLVTTGPQIQALVNRQVVGMIGSGQFPAQNFSDTDRIFLEKILPSLANQPEANALITATTERLLQIETQKRQAWAQARRNKVSFRDFETDWNDKLQKEDIFGDIAKQAGAGGAGAGDPASMSDDELLRALGR